MVSARGVVPGSATQIPARLDVTVPARVRAGPAAGPPGFRRRRDWRVDIGECPGGPGVGSWVCREVPEIPGRVVVTAVVAGWATGPPGWQVVAPARLGPHEVLLVGDCGWAEARPRAWPDNRGWESGGDRLLTVCLSACGYGVDRSQRWLGLRARTAVRWHRPGPAGSRRRQGSKVR